MEKVLCLMYHRVNDYGDDPFNITVSCENFRNQIEYIANEYHVLRFEEDWKSVKSDKLGVCLTFDDGYEDFALYAAPIMKEYGVPATVFVCTGYIEERRELWYDELVSYCTKGRNYPERFHLEDSLYEYTWETDTYEKRLELAKTLRWLLRMENDWSRFDSFIEQLKSFSRLEGIKDSSNYLMNVEQLKEVAANPLVTIGGHTKYHRSLGSMDKKSQRETIESSINYLRDITMQNVEVFAYPFGMGMDFGDDTISILKDIGIKKAPSTNQSIWGPECNPYKTPRYGVRNWDEAEFKEKLEKFWKI